MESGQLLPRENMTLHERASTIGAPRYRRGIFPLAINLAGRAARRAYRSSFRARYVTCQ